MLDAVRLVVAQSDFRVGNVGVQVRASDDADPATGYADASRCLAGARRAAADRHAIAVIGTYESSCTLVALPALAAAGLALVSPVNTDPLVAAPGSAGAERADPARPARLRAGRRRGRGGDRPRRAPPVRALRSFGARAAHADGADRGSSRIRRAASPWSAASGLRGRHPSVRGLVARVRAARADAVWIGAGADPVSGRPAARARAHRRRALDLHGPRSRCSAATRSTATVCCAPRVRPRRASTSPPGSFRRTRSEVPGPTSSTRSHGSSDSRGCTPHTRLTPHVSCSRRSRRSDGTRAGMLRALGSTRSYHGLIGKVAIDRHGASTLARLAIFEVRNGSFRLERTLDLGQGLTARHTHRLRRSR